MALYAVEGPEVTRVFPTQGAVSAAIVAGQAQRLPQGAEVAGVSPCEWLVAVFSDVPLQLSDLHTQLAGAAALAARSSQCQPPGKIVEARTTLTMPVRLCRGCCLMYCVLCCYL